MNRSTRDVLLREIHRAIRESAAAALKNLRSGSPELDYPPNVALIEDEREAIRTLNLSPAACSAFEKIVADAACYPLFHLFTLIDGFGDPADADGWNGVHLAEGGREAHEMLHGELFESYWASVDPPAADDQTRRA